MRQVRVCQLWKGSRINVELSVVRRCVMMGVAVPLMMMDMRSTASCLMRLAAIRTAARRCPRNHCGVNAAACRCIRTPKASSTTHDRVHVGGRQSTSRGPCCSGWIM
jgi:hypothetical protein